MSGWRSAVRIVGFLLALASPSIAADSTDNAAEFGRRLNQNYIVLEGVVLDSARVPQKDSPLNYDFKIAVTRVRRGAIDDSIAILSTGRRPQFIGISRIVGSRVIAWGWRDRRNDWRMTGNMACITPDGRLHFDTWVGPSSGKGIKYADLNARLGEDNASGFGAAFVGAAGVGLVEVRRVDRLEEGLVRVRSDSIATVLGAVDRLPRTIVFRRDAYCYEDLEVGDRMLVPVASGFRGEEMKMNACPGGLVVRNGYAQGLGAPIDSLQLAIEPSQNGFKIKPFRAR